ncbi:MAG TPA: serine/threonine-protein kinase [Polyangiales bacterium]|nr:serine/threonine-protein kinase [Polyangiales bacterium]
MHSSQPVLVSIDLPRPGDELGSYVIERQLGQGGMAVVYEARHRAIGKRVALKMLLPHHAAHPELAQRFQREGEAAALLDHANAVAVLDGGADARGTPFLVMEYLEGEDLGNVLSREGRLGVERTVDLLLPMIAAIAAAHDLGIVHRDLKPENLFLARRHGQLVPKVLDFGISKTNEADSMKLTRSESLLGTPHYMSPEQAQGAGQADAQSDQFAIGVMLYECVTGKCPFEGNSLFAVLAAIVGGTLTPPSELVPGLDPVFEAIVTRTLNKEPEARFPDLRTLGSALLPLASPRVRLAYADELGASSSDFGRSYEVTFEALRGPPRETLVVPVPVAVSAAPSLPPPPSGVRTPMLVGSAFVIAAAASLTVAALDEDKPSSDDSSKVGRVSKPTPAPAQAERPRTNSNPEQPVDNIEAPRKPSGLRFEAIDAPSLCLSDEER